ncbi:hypothetical protein Moror_7829 [Moniliophthora roreri MCA 2997]|uniref:Fungal lipase-type domain-containing protein n=2 Tax=Moniliophthora roreri TaxID=221103 RepID=V2XC58_MONRO|nr:hypothetical protein Moror_7829 [Moniliophthora roreri MCA 2997]KAI3607723.1 hypothetical protein WG66_004782 [Moniliophthora roreri]
MKAFSGTVAVVSALFSAFGAGAAPAPTLYARQSVTALSAAQISAFKPFTFFAGAGYCEPAKTLAWNCGANCNANADFKPIASGGDGGDIQFWYVGFSPSLKTVIVAHQGTDITEIESLCTDARFFLRPLNSALFPGVSSSVKVHSGFADVQEKTAAKILAAVKTAMADNNTKTITLVGHSLGAAISLIDSLYLRLQLPNAEIKTIGYGMPRVGNPEFANLVDASTKLTRITNQDDFIPIIPGRGLGYRHPQGEVHIAQNSAWNVCPGQDSTAAGCTINDVPNIFVGNIFDHPGPYDDVVTLC